LRYSEDAFSTVAASVSVLAESEGLAAHARSALVRKEGFAQRRKEQEGDAKIT
jgi:histidinol dehydrogenase